jgi:hypothetical protein
MTTINDEEFKHNKPRNTYYEEPKKDEIVLR